MKTIQQTGLITMTLVAAGATLLLSGCGTTANYKQADKTGAGIAEFRDEIVKGKEAVDMTMKSLSDIAAAAATDPRPAYEKYVKDLSNLESTAEKIKKRAADMKEQGQAYFKQWEMELSQVSNPDIRKLAEDRKAKLQDTFSSVQKYTEPLKTQFDPWMANLKDLKTYLGNDLTIAGVEAAKDLFSKTTDEGLEVQKSMDGLVAELNTISATVTPAKMEPK